MPIGKPKSQTIASAKYQQKAGYIAKTFKLKKDIVDEFASTCQKTGISQAAAITKFMTDFIQANQ